MAKTNIDKIYEQLDKAENANELFDCFEKLKDFIAKKIIHQAEEKENEAAELNSLVQKINGN